MLGKAGIIITPKIQTIYFYFIDKIEVFKFLLSYPDDCSAREQSFFFRIIRVSALVSNYSAQVSNNSAQLLKGWSGKETRQRISPPRSLSVVILVVDKTRCQQTPLPNWDKSGYSKSLKYLTNCSSCCLFTLIPSGVWNHAISSASF